MIPNFRNNKFKNVFLVTGGAGFIGSNLCEHLLKLGAGVVCLDDLSTGKIENIESFLNSPDFTFIKGDIRDFQICLNATKGIDFVLHQAAWGSVPRSFLMPLEYEEINIKGTLNMLEASKVNKVKRFIYASSSSVYGDQKELPKVEHRIGKILSPYALTKKTNEEFSSLYWEFYKLPTIGLRYFNVFGKRQNPEGFYAAVIPKFIKKILKNEQIEIYGDGNQSRDFTYIDNVVNANINACFSNNVKAFGNVFNIACGEQITLKEVINKISSILNKKIPIQFLPKRDGDIEHSLADIKRAKKLINYNPRTNFSNGLKAYIKWYKNQK